MHTTLIFQANHTINYSYQRNKGTELKILTPKQMLEILPTALAQVKAGNNSKNSLTEIRQIFCFLYQAK